MQATPDVCIRGDGIVARVLALLLARERLRVALPPPDAAAHAAADGPHDASGHGDVRAYALNDASRQLLQQLRCWPGDGACTPVAAMAVHGDDGGELHFRAERYGAEALAWIVDVPALEARLGEALRYQPQVDTASAGACASVALTAVCEGRASATRRAFGVGFNTTPYPQRAIAARLNCALPHGGIARQWLAPEGILALLPMGGAAGTTVALVWSVAPQRAGELMALAPDAFAAAVQAAARDALGAMALASERADWPLQLALAQHWCGPWPGTAHAASPATAAAPRSWVLAGDAAHTVHPLAGQGLNLGLADAAELARQIGTRAAWRSVGDLHVLRRYERARKAALWPMGRATDGLQQLFALPSQPWQGLRNLGLSGVDAVPPVKRWLARQAMGTAAGPRA